MAINPLSGIISGASNQIQRNNNRIQDTIAQLVTGNRFTNASTDVAGLSLAAQLQSQLSSLRQSASNISQGLSTVQVASDAVDRQIRVVDRLQQLATQANNGAISDEVRKGLNSEAQSLLKELDRISDKAAFSNQKLLDGTFKISIDQSFGQEQSEDGANLEVPELSSRALFPNGFDLSTQEGAQAALASLTSARDTLTSARADIGSFSISLDYAGASLESALFNQDAARATIEETDFAEASTQLSLLKIQQNAALALKAQTNKLPANVLDLLNGIENS